jgi:hypothetical protein
MVVGRGSRLAAAGIGIGPAVAPRATRLLEGLLFGVQPTDPLTFAAVAALLMAVDRRLRRTRPARHARGSAHRLRGD